MPSRLWHLLTSCPEQSYARSATNRNRTLDRQTQAAEKNDPTGPRSPEGQLKSASNSLKHGLYSIKNFDNFIADHDQALAVATNFIEQFNPITPTEVVLVHQLINMQIRFLQMEFLYGQAMRFRTEDILANPVNFLPAILRELDRLPSRIQRTIKILRAEIAQREAYIGHGENVEIEAIADTEKLPGRTTHKPASPWPNKSSATSQKRWEPSTASPIHQNRLKQSRTNQTVHLSQKITFDGMQFRRDIGQKGLKRYTI